MIKLESLRTTTLVRTESIYATSVSTRIGRALIIVQTLVKIMVRNVAFRAFTFEASHKILKYQKLTFKMCLLM